MPADKHLVELERLFLGLGDKTRLRILNLIRNDEICVSHFTEVLGESQPKISRHLAYLRRSGIVSARREGTWMHYSINRPADDHAARMLDNLLDGLASRPEMRREHEKLLKSLKMSGSEPRKGGLPESVATESEAAVVRDEPVREEWRWQDDEPLETHLL